MTFIPFTPPSKAAGTPQGERAMLPTVLYVEDEDVNWEVTEKSVRDRYHLIRARNAGEALQELGKRNFDLILMDIQLSGSDLNGIELTTALRGKPGSKRSAGGMSVPLVSTPIVFVTAYTARYSREELLAAGGDDLVTKPISVTGLLLVMSRLSMRALRAGSPPT